MSSTWSYWEIAPIFEKQDVVIIGSGIVGINTAIAIKTQNPNAKVLVIDRKYPGLGASTKNAGFACFGSPSEIFDDINTTGEDATFQLIKNRWEGLTYLQELVDPKEMEFQQNGSFELFFKGDENLEQVLDQFSLIEKIACEALGEHSVFNIRDNPYFPHLSSKAIYSKHEGSLNPMSMMNSLSAKAKKMGINFLYGIEVSKIEKNKVNTKSGKTIDTDRIAICANGFSTGLIEIDDVKCVRNQVLISEPIPNLKWIETFHLNKGYLYFRNYQGRLLIGGGRDMDHEGESTDLFGENQKIIEYLEDLSLNIILEKKDVSFQHSWSGILGVGKSKQPIIEKISDGIFAGIRLGGMGIAIGSLVGKKLAALVLSDS